MKRRYLSLQKEVNAILAKHDPAGIVAGNPYAADEYEIEAAEIVRHLKREEAAPAPAVDEVVRDVLVRSFDAESLDMRAVRSVAAEVVRLESRTTW